VPKQRAELRLFYTNACSLLNKLPELRSYLCFHNLDVLAISETWFNPDICDAEIALPGYISFRQDRAPSRRGGGVLLYIRQDLHPIIIPSQLPCPNVDVIACRLTLLNQYLPITTIYRSPSATRDEDRILLTEIRRLSHLYQDGIILGDLNCPNFEWTDMTAPEGSFDDDLLETLDDSFLIQLVFSPTR